MQLRSLTVTTPESVSAPIFTGHLVAAVPLGGTEKKRGAGGGHRHELLALGTVVSIGRPEWWDLRKVLQPTEGNASPLLRDLLTRYDLFLVQLVCSLTPQDKSTITSAEFSASLISSQDTSNAPVAHDLFPSNVSRSEERNVKMKLSPSLKFQKLEAGLGEIGLDMEYKVLIPEVTAFGLGEASFGWILTGSSQWPVVGVRCFYAVVKRLINRERISVAINLYADIETPRGLFRCALSKEVQQSLICHIG
jgi:hypothetical protein